MTTHRDDPFLSRFLDDYFAECEDHLAVVRQTLLTLEGAVGGGPRAAELDEMMRRFHSLKGISGMVEFRDAETLAHHLESYVRLLQRGEAALSAEGLETLIDGARAFERLVAAYRAHSPIPETHALLARVERLLHVRDAVPARAGAERREPHPPSRTWIVAFTPSAELQARGVTINAIRQRLGALAEIADVTPHVSPSGGVRFEFVLHGDIDPAVLEGWADDGVIISRALEAVAEPAATPPAPPPLPVSNVTAPAAAHYVRVDLARLDDLMRLVADVVITRARLDDALTRAERAVPAAQFRAVQEQMTAMERQVRDLREGVMRIRLVPVGEVFQRMPFVVRDLAREAGKQVRLDVEGQQAAIDKFLTERIIDPLVHLVRNAISHGIETPAERLAAGKPAQARILLRAANVADTVAIAVADDGRGIDRQAVLARARAAGFEVDQDADGAALLDVLCAEGFSTRDEADRASGRGVGMSVVKRMVQGLGGTLTLETSVGEGTTFVMTLPLTLAITDALLASVGRHLFAVPQSAVQELIEVDPVTIRRFENNELMPYRGGVLPLVRLTALFGLEAGVRPTYHAIVIGAGLSSVGLLVDRVAGHREVVVRALSDPLVRVEGVSGATELGDGRAVLILDVAGLLARVRQGPVARGAAPPLM